MKEVDCLLLPLNGTADKAFLEKMSKLKYIGTLATGFDKIDISSAREKGIVVTNVPGYSTNAVAEFVFAATLEHVREMSRAKAQGKNGDYSEATFEGSELSDKTFGIIGLGQIGQKTAKIASGFGCKTIYWSRNRKDTFEKAGIEYRPLEEVLQTSDFLSVHLESNPQTNGIIDLARVKRIKKGTIIINTCNTTLFDLETLIERIKTGELVYITMASRTKPEVVARLNAVTHAIVYPPVTYKTKEAHALRQKIFLQNMTGFLEGKVQNKVN